MRSTNPPLLSRPLLIFLGAMILANVARTMHQSFMPLYLQSLGASIGQVGLFFTLSAIAPLVFQILGGWLSDSIGRLQAIAIGSLAGVASYLVYLVAPTWHWLLISTALGAMAVSFVYPSYQAFIAEQSTEATRGRVFGFIEGVYNIVGVIGPPIGGFLSLRFGFKPMFAAALGLYGSATVIRLFMARGAQKTRAAEAAPGERPSLAGLKHNLLAMSGLIAGGGIVTWIFISDGMRDIFWNLSSQLEPLYMHNIGGLTNLQIGWLVSLASFTTMVLMTPAGWLSDKKGERVGIAVGMTAVCAGMIVFIHSTSFFGFALAWLMFGAAEALISPAYSSLISKVVPLKLRGTAFGLFSTSIGLISLPAPWIGAQLWQTFGPRVPFYVPVVMTLATVPIIWSKFRLPKEGKEARELKDLHVPTTT